MQMSYKLRGSQILDFLYACFFMTVTVTDCDCAVTARVTGHGYNVLEDYLFIKETGMQLVID
jgi:hypothetical protein